MNNISQQLHQSTNIDGVYASKPVKKGNVVLLASEVPIDFALPRSEDPNCVIEMVPKGAFQSGDGIGDGKGEVGGGEEGDEDGDGDGDEEGDDEKDEQNECENEDELENEDGDEDEDGDGDEDEDGDEDGEESEEEEGCLVALRDITVGEWLTVAPSSDEEDEDDDDGDE
jgi:hypothetical protein